jgi:hypothetical protein
LKLLETKPIISVTALGTFPKSHVVKILKISLATQPAFITKSKKDSAI